MPLWPNFIGPSYRTQSSTIASDTAINIYLETTRNAADPKKATFYGTPGQVLWGSGALAPEVECRGLFSQDGRVFGVHGATFWELNPAAAPPRMQHQHPVANDHQLVTFASNGIGGNQLAICSAGVLYILDLVTAVWTTVALSFVPVMVGYMDGYFLANEKNTPKMWFSNLFNGLTWSATDFFTRSSTSDNLTGFAVNNRRIWVLGSKTTELFQDSGDATTPFIPIPGSVINEGTDSYQSITSIVDTVFWVGATKEYGHNNIFAATGLQPRVISPPAISAAISPTAIATEAEVLTYAQGGHVHVCWTWPSIDLTLCYDLTEEAWHQRADVAETSPGSGLYNTPHRWRARGSCGFATTAASGGLPVILVGQVDTAFLCELRLDTSTDEHPTAPPVPIFRLRIAPYVSAENQWLFLQQVELGIQAVADFGGQPPPQLYVGQAGGSDLASLYPPMDAAVGLAVNGLAVAQWFQLGRHRTDHLLLAISQNNTLPCVWGPGLWLRATPGTGQL